MKAEFEASWVNGHPTDLVSVADRGLQYGDGLFETLAIYHGSPIMWERHLQRLFTGAVQLGISPPPISLLRREVELACEGVERGCLKLILTRGFSARGYSVETGQRANRIMTRTPWPQDTPQFASAGVSVGVCALRLGHQPRLAGIKHLNRLEQVLARDEMERGHDEGLLLDNDDYVIEGTATNIFMMSDDTLITPDLSRCGVEGVMRAWVLDHALGAKQHSQIANITLDHVHRAREVFLTNSLIGIWPVINIESKTYPIGETTRAFQKALAESFPLYQTV